MAKYLFVYHGGGEPSTPRDARKITRRWNNWFVSMGYAELGDVQPCPAKGSLPDPAHKPSPRRIASRLARAPSNGVRFPIGPFCSTVIQPE